MRPQGLMCQGWCSYRFVPQGRHMSPCQSYRNTCVVSHCQGGGSVTSALTVVPSLRQRAQPQDHVNSGPRNMSNTQNIGYRASFEKPKSWTSPSTHLASSSTSRLVLLSLGLSRVHGICKRVWHRIEVSWIEFRKKEMRDAKKIDNFEGEKRK